MPDLLTDKYRRRWFVAASVAALLALLATRFLLLPRIWSLPANTLPQVFDSLLETFITSLAASLMIAAVVSWLTPPMAVTATMEVVEPVAIKHTLEQALLGTDEWWYRGHSGRHFRSVTLPRLATESRAQNLTKRVVIQVLDPRSDQTCEYYAQYRQRLRSAKRGRGWTKERVRAELLATIVSAYAWREKEPGLDITVGLIDSVSLFRVDLSSSLALITKEDPQEPALRCDSGTFFYRSYREDLLMSLQQARTLSAAVRTTLPEQLTTDAVKTLLVALGVASGSVPDTTMSEVLTLVQRAENPYG